MIWSILISGIPERYHLVQPLLYSILEVQGVARDPDIELLYLLDSRRRSVGAKRNVLLDAAQGDYISFVDDDDMVSGDYVQRVLDALKQNPSVDVVCFKQRATIQPAGIVHECTYSLANKERTLKPTVNPTVFDWSGPPAHTMIWRRETVAGVRFAEKQFGEDVDWVDAACTLAKTEMRIEGPALYYYKFSEEGTSTRG